METREMQQNVLSCSIRTELQAQMAYLSKAKYDWRPLELRAGPDGLFVKRSLEVFPHENGALPLSYRPKVDRTGFEPAASPLAMEVSRRAVTGKMYVSRRLCDLSILAGSFDLLDSSNTYLAETRVPYSPRALTSLCPRED